MGDALPAVTATAPGTFTDADGSDGLGDLHEPDAELGRTPTTARRRSSRCRSRAASCAVVIALPHGDLATYEAASRRVAGRVRAARLGARDLSLPKFAFTSPTFSLDAALQAMGMTQAFDPDAADFTGMCAHPPDGDHLYVDDVLQKAMVAMQETGVEAAAATAVIVDRHLGRRPPTDRHDDRQPPFLMAIVDADGRHPLPRSHRGPDRRRQPVAPSRPSARADLAGSRPQRVPLMAFFCFLPIVWRALRVSFRLATVCTIFSALIFALFRGERPKSRSVGLAAP